MNRFAEKGEFPRSRLEPGHREDWSKVLLIKGKNKSLGNLRHWEILGANSALGAFRVEIAVSVGLRRLQCPTRVQPLKVGRVAGSLDVTGEALI
jgi:hypothetical protein